MAGIEERLTNVATGVTIHLWTRTRPLSVTCGYCGMWQHKAGTATREDGDFIEVADICLDCAQDLDRLNRAFSPQRRRPKQAGK
jgi:hypothetical protein